MNLTVYYRGPLTSCNYGCSYCPFAKRVETKQQLGADRDAVRRFVTWLGNQAAHRWKILFTPWGEALVRSWYRQALVETSHLPHVRWVAIQTNLSCGIDWIQRCNVERLVLWATYHPSETPLAPFVEKVRRIRSLGARLSVGLVTEPDALETPEILRRSLPDDVYLWLNPRQPRSRPFTADEIQRLAAIDPYFPWLLRRKKSKGLNCRAGSHAFTIDGQGDMRRCHFVEEIIGNIFSSDWEQALRSRPCPNQFCDCYLGQSQLKADVLARDFGETTAARLPIHWDRATLANI